MDISNLISIIIIKKGRNINLTNPLLPLEKYHHVFIALTDEWEEGVKNIIRFDSKQMEKVEYSAITAITTPWVLFLEEQEYLSSADNKRLINYAKKEESAVTTLNVERLIPPEKLSNYAWVTTRTVFNNPSNTMRRYFASEVRLIPRNHLKDIVLNRSSQDASEDGFILKSNLHSTRTAHADISVSRYSPYQSKKTLAPSDIKIFKYGHQQYFEDEVFSPRFIWPHTVYNTIRFDHIPSIFSAMKEGLSSPDIVISALAYLIHFNKFSTAFELMTFIPEHWSKRDPSLINIIATIHFINGDHETALKLYEYAVNLFPEFEMIVRNAVKIHILLDRYDAIDEIIHRYKKATGKELRDDFYTEFNSIHKGIPEKTVTLSLCLIIKDEEKTLERAILSAKQIADEIIVVDTGSIDFSSDIAEKQGAKVFQYHWSDDFSAARNFAISKATCDYIMMLDGDEYISPFFYLNCMAMKKMLSTDEPYALNISIGSYFNETDWLFLVRETGNFRTETTSTRIFPRQSGIEYEGCIKETIEPSLFRKNIPIRIMPDLSIHIVHDTAMRLERIERKYHIYRKLNDADYSLMLSAIRDFSFLGKTEETLQWLNKFYNNYSDSDEIKLKVGLKLAKLLETNKPLQTDKFYEELSKVYPDELSVILSYADYLLKNNRLDGIKSLSFDLRHIETKNSQKDQIELKCFQSLQFFELKDYDRAFEILTEILDESAVVVFAQSLRFYYLICINDLEGAVAALDCLFNIFDCREYFKIERIEDILGVVEKASDQLLKKGYIKESALILEGMSSLAQRWR